MAVPAGAMVRRRALLAGAVGLSGSGRVKRELASSVAVAGLVEARGAGGGGDGGRARAAVSAGAAVATAVVVAAIAAIAAIAVEPALTAVAAVAAAIFASVAAMAAVAAVVAILTAFAGRSPPRVGVSNLLISLVVGVRLIFLGVGVRALATFSEARHR
ncbi:MAG: hypothetical protein ACRDRO_07765 [Pseudonocardiaceae bacterium]